MYVLKQTFKSNHSFSFSLYTRYKLKYLQRQNNSTFYSYISNIQANTNSLLITNSYSNNTLSVIDSLKLHTCHFAFSTPHEYIVRVSLKLEFLKKKEIV